MRAAMMMTGLALGVGLSVLTGAALAPTPEPVEPIAVEAEGVQLVEVVGDGEPVERDEVAASAPVEPAPIAPADAVAPTPVDVPALCEAGLIPVEDGSCVPPTFFDEPVQHPTLTVPPCESDDGYAPGGSCYWGAATMGNGQGSSFVVLDGVFYYAEAGR